MCILGGLSVRGPVIGPWGWDRGWRSGAWAMGTLPSGWPKWEVTHHLNTDVCWGTGQELCRSLASRWFPQWRNLAGGTQGQVFLAGPRQKSSVRQVLSHWLQIWGGRPQGNRLTRAGPNRSESPPPKVSFGWGLQTQFSSTDAYWLPTVCRALEKAEDWLGGEYKRGNQGGIQAIWPGKI